MAGNKDHCPQCGRFLKNGRCTGNHTAAQNQYTRDLPLRTQASGTTTTAPDPVKKIANIFGAFQTLPTASSPSGNVRPSVPSRPLKPELCYGPENVYHGSIKVSLTRVQKTLAAIRTGSASKGQVADAIYRTAVLVNEYNPDLHGGEPNVLSAHTRAEASWTVNQHLSTGPSSFFVVDPSNSGAIYLNSHVRELLKSTDTDLRSNPKLNEALRRHQDR